jgi:hypothetical protein
MKIEIRELKIGNWVEARNGYDSEDYYAQIDIDSFGDKRFINNLRTIPFTTEWAERFNLIGSVINGFCIAPSEYKGHDYDLCLYDEHTWDSERTILCPINSVHHCQNLFLDLANHILE